MKRLLVGFVLSIAVSLVVVALSAPPPARVKKKDVSADKAKQPQADRPANSEPTPVFIYSSENVVDAATAEQIRANAQYLSKPWWQKHEWVMVFVTAAAALFAFLAFGVAALQARYLKEQLRAATSPRLFVDGVRMTKFALGERPLFFVKIVNSGPADAESVMVDIRVEPARAGVNGVKYSEGAQPINIPDNSSREYFIELKETLTHDVRDGIKFRDWPLRVTGFIQERGREQRQYDYKYYPWDDPRPRDVPEFLPSDFSTRRTTLIIPAVADTTDEALAPTVSLKPQQ